MANALKPVVLPGETMEVKIIKPGEESQQGIGYLDDGTMVVVEDARDRIGENNTDCGNKFAADIGRPNDFRQDASGPVPNSSATAAPSGISGPPRREKAGFVRTAEQLAIH